MIQRTRQKQTISYSSHEGKKTRKKTQQKQTITILTHPPSLKKLRETSEKPNFSKMNKKHSSPHKGYSSFEHKGRSSRYQASQLKHNKEKIIVSTKKRLNGKYQPGPVASAVSTGPLCKTIKPALSVAIRRLAEHNTRMNERSESM